MGSRNGLNSQSVTFLSCQARLALEPLLLALIGWHEYSMVENEMSTLPALANLLQLNSW